jgi:hypothetical protein
MIDLDTLQRRQDQRKQHAQALQALIDEKQRELDNLRANGRIGRTVHRFALVHGYER